MLTNYSISKEQKKEYLEKGYTSIKNGISPELLNRLQIMAEKFEKKIIKDYKNGIHTLDACISNEKLIRYNNIIGVESKIVLELLSSPIIIAIFRDICGKGAIPLGVDLLYKQPSIDSAVLWHQDAPHSRNYPYINVGIYLDDSNENDGCLQYVPKTQNKKQDIYKLTQQFGWDIPNSIELPAKAGDINIHDMMILHGSKPKRIQNPRRTIYLEIRPYDAFVEEGIKSKEWIESRKRLMGIILRQANPLFWPESWKKDYPNNLKMDEEEISNILKKSEPAIAANYAFPPVKRKDYPIPEDYKSKTLDKKNFNITKKIKVNSKLEKNNVDISFKLGELGIFHIKSFWLRMIGKVTSNHFLKQLDYFVLDGLNINIANATKYILTNQPSFKEFEKWILKQNHNHISPNTINKINNAVNDYIKNGSKDYPLRTVMEEPIFTVNEKRINELWK